MFKILIYSAIVFLQAGLVKACATSDKVLLKEGAVIEKSIAKDGEALLSVYKITKADSKILKQASESLSFIEKNEKIASEFAAVKNDRSEKIKNIINNIDIPIPDNSANNISDNTPEEYVNEILNSEYFVPFCKVVRYKFKNENLNNEEVTSLLKGNKIDTLELKPQSLFNIYYMYSKKFAENVLIQVALKTNCDKDKIEQIKQIADSRGIPSNSLLYGILKKCD
jgi:hypothetical protein